MMANDQGIKFHFNQLKCNPVGNEVPVENIHRVLLLPDMSHLVFLPDGGGGRQRKNIKGGGDRIWPQMKHFLFKLST